jgi:HAD superfamily hydrolase (TIGR01509 family)
VTSIIFDLDGTIIDTETPEFRSWQQVYESYGRHLDRAEWSQVIGTSDADWDPLLHLETLLGRSLDPDSVREQQRDRFDRLIAGAGPRPGIVEWLDEARDLGLGVGLASSSSAAWVELFLARLGLRDRFAVLATRDRVARSKPDPELYELARRELGDEPAETIAVEDSPNGLAAAKAAGIFCVAVPNPMTAALPFTGADLLLDSLADISLAQVLASRRPAAGR